MDALNLIPTFVLHLNLHLLEAPQIQELIVHHQEKMELCLQLQHHRVQDDQHKESSLVQVMNLDPEAEQRRTLLHHYRHLPLQQLLPNANPYKQVSELQINNLRYDLHHRIQRLQIRRLTLHLRRQLRQHRVQGLAHRMSELLCSCGKVPWSKGKAERTPEVIGSPFTLTTI